MKRFCSFLLLSILYNLMKQLIWRIPGSSIPRIKGTTRSTLGCLQLVGLSGHVTSSIPRSAGRMSQFKCREWWSTVSGFEEFHDLGSLSTATIFGKGEFRMLLPRPCAITLPPHPPAPPELLLVGSYQGYLRVYAPSEGGFCPDHVVLETDLGLPVLQVAAVYLLP